ncbi:MAG TPA: acetylxylan esterase, partial [Candidatus Glassbacteria bacterium]|nr:acetylxylan esterase [Candidatus Glassbacteria bacterium]
GFRVAKVYFESLPGFYVTGNLYRPAEGSGPFPAVVCPHGHWYYGRLTNGESGSIPGRCIDLARMGFVVMSIDMVGYNDSFQFPHDPGKSLRQLKADEPVPYEPNLYRGDFDFPRAGLYGVSLAGLHVWNVIRTVDFLVSLPEVDPERIGCTGASGGASQTLFLMATDERLKVAAPVNIVGAEKHPGCRCENAPGSWVDISTVEIAGTFAPRPLILISATEDPWTNSFPTRELSIIKKYYALYGAEDKVTNAHIPGGHNYNAQSRAAVYNWFAEHLKSPRPAIKNPPAIAPEMKTLGDLRVFPDKLLPETSKSGLDVLRDWMASSEKAYEVALPKKGTELAAFTEKFGGALFRLLQLDRPAPSDIIAMKLEDQALGGFSHEKLVIGRQGKGDRVDVEVIVAGSEPKGTLVLVRPESRGGMFMPGGGGFKPALKNLAVSNYRICRVGGYASGELRIPRKTW